MKITVILIISFLSIHCFAGAKHHKVIAYYKGIGSLPKELDKFQPGGRPINLRKRRGRNRKT